MPDPTLSIVLIEDTEKPQDYTRLWFDSVSHWNMSCLESGDAEVVVITQRQDPGPTKALCAAQKFPVKVVHAGHDYVGDNCIWDVLAGLRKAWPHVHGRHFTVNHTEFIWCHDRIFHTVEWLKANPYYVAVGNLRRPANEWEGRESWKPGSCNKEISDVLLGLMDRGEWVKSARYAALMPTIHWPLWKSRPVPPGICDSWHEDAFFIDREWFETWDAINHGGEQPFQDIWDLIGVAINQMKLRELNPVMFKLPQEINRIVHLWHPKGYAPWNETVRDWFFSNPERWEGTRFTEEIMWESLLDMMAGRTKDQQPKFNLRRGPLGTVNRYVTDVRSCLNNGGGERLAAFYGLHGRQMRLS